MNITLNNIRLNYIKEGSGQPLILLHGNGEDHHIFDRLIEKLKKYFTVYAIDSRNHGLSSKTNDYSYETMAGDLFLFIEKLNLDQPSILGFSDGAITSLVMALQKQNLFHKMVLLGVNLKPSDFKEENFNYLQEQYQKTKDPLTKLMLEEPNIELDDLKNIATPTLIIAAEDDLFKDELYENMVKIMPNAELKIMLGHEHDSYVVNQNILYPELINFL